MDLLKNIKTTSRNQDLYSSQRQLVDEDIIVDDQLEVEYLQDYADRTSTPTKNKHTPLHMKDDISFVSEKTLKTKNAFSPSIHGSSNDSDKKVQIADVKGSISNERSTINKIKIKSTKNEIIESSSNSPGSAKVAKYPQRNLSKIFNKDLHKSSDQHSDSISDNISYEILSEKNENASIKKHRKKTKRKQEDIEMKQIELNKTPTGSNQVTKDEKNIKIIGIHILNSGNFQEHPYLNCLIVKLEIVDITTGNKIKCISNIDKAAISNETVTKRYDFSINRSIIPQWNEVILIDDDATNKIKDHKNMIIFFQVLDILSNDDENKFRKVAWAFLKPFGKNRINNINHMISLQLYNYLESETTTSESAVYELWSTKPWKVYPNTLQVVVKGVKVTETQDAINSIKLSILQDAKLKNASASLDSGDSYLNKNLIHMHRSKGEYCRIPNRMMKYLSISAKASIVLKFSPCGNFLACSVSKQNKHVIQIYKVPEFSEERELIYHKDLIYDLCWGTSQNLLISASADSNVCVWNLMSKENSLLQHLSHPTFVYSSRFCNSDDVIVSGGFDKIIRIWTNDKIKQKYYLSQELLGHSGFINAICFLKESLTFYSADSEGVIIKWGYKDCWVKIIKLNIIEMKGKIINDLVIFPHSNRMLITLRNSNSWALDLATNLMFTCYKDGTELRYQMRSSISPCGTLIFIGNNIWSASTGHLLGFYNPSLFDHHSIMAVDYHPCYEIIAIGTGHKGVPLLIGEYYKQNKVPDTYIGLELLSSLEEPNQELLNPTFSKNKTATHPEIPSVKVLLEKTKLANNDTSMKTNLKLWDLINKMDDILLDINKSSKDVPNVPEIIQNESTTTFIINKPRENIRNSKENLVFTSPDSLKSSATNNRESAFSIEKEKKNHLVKPISTATFTIETTKRQKKLQTAEIENATSTDSESRKISANSYEGTYVVDKEENSASLDKPSNKDSTSLSNAESLDDDMFTYSLTLENVKHLNN